MLSIWSSFADLSDPRSGNAQRHNLLDLLTIALTATVCGAESCVDFADFARDREELFRDFLALPGGLPSHDTFSRLFRLLDLRGSLVTGDALHCQAETARLIQQRGGDWLFTLKDNRPGLRAEVAAWFADPLSRPKLEHRTTDAEHGRIELRRCQP